MLDDIIQFSTTTDSTNDYDDGDFYRITGYFKRTL